MVAVEIAFAVFLLDESFGSIIPLGIWVEFSSELLSYNSCDIMIFFVG